MSVASSHKGRLPTIPFTYQEALKAGWNKYFLKKMVEKGKVEKLDRNLYRRTGKDEDLEENQYRIATIRCGLPSSLCLLSALSYYHVTDEIPRQTWVLVPESKRVASEELKLIRSRNPQWDIGIHKTKHYWITTLERTLIDGIIYKKLIGSQVALAAIKEAISQKKVKLGTLYDMAKKMGVEHRVLPYIETLAS